MVYEADMMRKYTARKMGAEVAENIQMAGRTRLADYDKSTSPFQSKGLDQQS